MENKSDLPIVLIAIDGRGGSGKSTLAKLLAKKFSAEIIHTDDFASWDNPTEWWPLVIEKVFLPIKNGAIALNYPRTKWWENRNPEPAINQPVTRVMILEGVSALRKEFRPYISCGILVDAPIEVCRQRVVERDKTTDESPEKIKELWAEWLKDENDYFERDRPERVADIIIDGTMSLHEQVKGISL